jgi:hypothetical protein
VWRRLQVTTSAQPHQRGSSLLSRPAIGKVVAASFAHCARLGPPDDVGSFGPACLVEPGSRCARGPLTGLTPRALGWRYCAVELRISASR